MYEVRVQPYVIKLLDEEKNLLPLSSFSIEESKGLDFFDIFLAYLEERGQALKDDDERSIFKVESFNLINERTVSGLIEKGNYGTASNIVDSQTATPTYRKKSSEADLNPYYFFLMVPRRGTHGILLLQRIKTEGIKGDLELDLGNYLKKYHEGIKLSIDLFLPPSFLKEAIQRSRITSVKFIKNEIPADISDWYDGGFDESEGSIELTIKAKARQSLPVQQQVMDFIENQSLRSSEDGQRFYTVGGEQFDKIKVTLNGQRKRTLDLQRANLFMDTSYVITESVPSGPDGHPDIDKMNEECLSIATSDIAKSLKIDE